MKSVASPSSNQLTDLYVFDDELGMLDACTLAYGEYDLRPYIPREPCLFLSLLPQRHISLNLLDHLPQGLSCSSTVILHIDRCSIINESHVTFVHHPTW